MWRGVFWFTICLLLTTQVQGVRAEDSGQQPISFQVLRDVPLSVQIEDICCNAARFTFPEETVSDVRTRYGETSIWLKIENVGPYGLIQLSPVLDDVTMFARPSVTSPWSRIRTGDQIANAQKLFPSPFMALPLPEGADTGAIYIRIIQTTAISINATAWELSTFVEMQGMDLVLKTFLLGFVVALIIYNVVVSVLVRDLVFLVNALCISSLLVLSQYLSGYGAVYFWSSRAGWSNPILVTSMFFSIMFGTAFVWLFIRDKNEGVRNGWMAFVGLASASMAAFGAVFLPYWAVMFWMLISAALFLFCVAGVLVHRAWRGDKRARLLLVPFGLAVMPGLSLIALNKVLGLSPFQLGNNAMEITLCLEAIFFSFALASRIRVTEEATLLANNRILILRNESVTKAIAAQDEERRRLSQELHDSVGQDFLVILNDLKRLMATDLPADIKASVAGLVASSTSALNGLRRVSRDMHPVMIEHLGLENAIRNLMENFGRSQPIRTRLDLNFSGSALARDVELHVFRIIQECISNISRHAEATSCELTIRAGGGWLEIVIEDDGCGLPHDAIGSSTGLGIVSIDERVRSLGGHWERTRGHLRGLKVRISIPLKDAGE